MSITAIGLFCDDIRQEADGSVTVVGIAPDGATVPSVPFTIPKIAVYTRISLTTDEAPTAMHVILRHPDGSEVQLAEFAEEFVRQTLDDVRKKGTPLAGFVGHSIAAPFRVTTEGRFLVILRLRTEERVIGSLNFQVGADSSEPA